MIDTLLNFFEHRADAEKAIIWIDLFCISQHENPELHVSPMWWRAFSKCIEDSKRMLLIIDSWNEPKPMQRSWYFEHNYTKPAAVALLLKLCFTSELLGAGACLMP